MAFLPRSSSGLPSTALSLPKIPTARRYQFTTRSQAQYLVDRMTCINTATPECKQRHRTRLSTTLKARLSQGDPPRQRRDSGCDRTAWDSVRRRAARSVARGCRRLETRRPPRTRAVAWDDGLASPSPGIDGLATDGRNRCRNGERCAGAARVGQ